ncbi:MAG TPA: tripartite tricarboxylate transporter substrate binding protein [Xanthobacteraceae bacterium]|nr:tripartite tricarboxylate transporter substrate binding protein [Xanthobacteraceae bacterium]
MNRLIRPALAVLASVILTGFASAQTFPTKEIRLVCGFVAGSGADIIHRYFASKLQQVSGHSFIVENRPGAAGNVASSYAAKAPPDGHTVYLVGGSSLASVPHLFKQPVVDPLKDFDSIGTILKQGWVLLVDAKSPHKNLSELTQHLKTKGAKASYSSATTIGTVMAELYKQRAGLDMVQVNYKTIADSLNDALDGRIDAVFGDPAFAIAQTKAGRLRPLAISSGERMKAMADLPTMAEGGVQGVDLMTWWITVVPAGTPQGPKDQLKKWFDQVLKMPETVEFLSNIGTDVFMSEPKEAHDFLVSEIKGWGENIRLAKIPAN